jgi:energy-coupling factor transporter ATP-binding protein EcfA2
MNDMSKTAPKPLRIVGLLAENVKKLQLVEIKPNGALVEITGKNTAGKSTLLDCISWAIEGARHIQVEPIRKGWSEAKIRLDLGELIITRRFHDIGDGEKAATDLEVRTAEGHKVRRPQEMLDALLGELTFDPGAFMHMKPDDRFDVMKRFVPDIDFEKFALDHQRDFDERASWNRRAKEEEAVALNLPADMGATDEPIDEAALVAKMAEAAQHNQDIEARKGRRQAAVEEIANCQRQARAQRDLAERLRREAEEAEAEAVRLAERAEALEEKLQSAAPLGELIDIAEIQKAIAAAKEHNAKIVGRGERLKHLKAARDARAKAEALTKQMEEREVEKQRKIAAAAMPVPGLGFAGNTITLGGAPFEQASTAEQLRASVGLAMAQNPRLKVILIREGSFIDSDGVDMLRQIAEERGFQIWMEKVESTRPGAIVIEDGAIKGIVGK